MAEPLTDAPTLFDLATAGDLTDSAAAAMRGADDAVMALHRASASYASDAFKLADIDEGWAFFYRTIARELDTIADRLGEVG